MAHYVITSDHGTDTISAWSERDAIEQYADKHDIDWQSSDELDTLADVRRATVREALTAEYGDDWVRTISHVVSVAEDRRYTRTTRNDFPSYDVDVVDVVTLNYTKGRDVFGYAEAVEVANYRVLRDRWSDYEGLTDGPWSNCSVIALDLDSTAPEDLTDVIDGLADYPVIDEDEWTTVEQEMIQEHWESYGKSDAAREVEKAIDADMLTDAAEEIIERLAFDGILDYGPATGYPTMIDASAVDFGEEAIAEFFRENFGKVVTVKSGNGYGEPVTFDLTRENIVLEAS